MPPSSTVPLRDPASSRTAECASRCHGEESFGANLYCSASGKQGDGDAEHGAHGNYDGHETSLQASFNANH